MRFLLVTVGTTGDVFPFLGLGRELRERGHRVSVVTHTTFGDRVRGAGLEFIDLDDAEPHRAMVEHPWFGSPMLSPAATAGWVVDSMCRQYRKIEEHYVEGETVLVSLVIAFGARIFQETRGAPHWSALISPMALRSRFRPSKMPFGWWPEWTPPFVNRIIYRAIDAFGLDRALAGINVFRSELGLAPTSRFLHDWWQSPTGILGLFPDWFAAPIPADWPRQLRMTGFPLYDAAEGAPLGAAIETFLADGPPPALVTGGSWLRDGRFFDSAVEGCRRAGLRCLVQTPFRALLPDALPDGVLHADYVAFGSLMPRCAALVHHAGVGTVAQGLAAGIPQVVIPQNFDQRDNAARLVSLGGAAWPANGRVRPSAVARALGDLLGSTRTQDACRNLAQRLCRDRSTATLALPEALRDVGTRPSPDRRPHP